MNKYERKKVDFQTQTRNVYMNNANFFMRQSFLFGNDAFFIKFFGKQFSTIIKPGLNKYTDLL